jgi:hypothetical protein
MPERGSTPPKPELGERDSPLPEPLRERLSMSEDDHARIDARGSENPYERRHECLRSADPAAPEDKSKAQSRIGRASGRIVHSGASSVGLKGGIRWVLSHA